MSSKIEFIKICQWCGNEFTAKKSSTLFCSHRCSNLAYKDKHRKKKQEQFQEEYNSKIENAPIVKLNEIEFLTPAQAAVLLGLSRATLYRYISEDIIKSVQFKRKTLLRRKDIDNLFENAEKYKKRNPIDKTPITDFYTTAEIKGKYKVSESWIFIQAKKFQIPKTSSKGKTLWSKKHIDKHFSVKTNISDITEWYTTDEIQAKFDMKLSIIYDFVYRNHILKKKEAGIVYYSAKHFDIAKGLIKAEEPQYYMVAEAMAKFNLTRDQLYHYVKYHKIPKVKFGKYTKISKPELDKLFEAPKID